MTPKALLFDLGNVIVPFDFKRGYAQLERLCPYPAAEIPRRLSPTGLVQRFESGEIEPEPFVRELSKILDLDISHRQFCDIWTSIFLPETLIPEAFLSRLSRDHRLVLLSNTNAIHYEMIERAYPHVGHFHEHVLSYRVGACKPSPRIFEEAVRRAGCRAGECFFTDDIPAYVEAAREAGIDAVQFLGFHQLKEELRARRVEAG